MANRYGTKNNNILSGTTGRDRIVGRGGNDILYGRGGRDVLLGGSGGDRIHLGIASRYSDVFGSRIDGGEGTDLAYLYLSEMTQKLKILPNFERITADAGDGTAPRTLVTIHGIEVLIAYLGTGDDYVLLGPREAIIRAGDGRDRLIGGDMHDDFRGDGGDDVLFGQDGGAGTDLILGGAGADDIVGADGADRLYGGDDRDTLSGGNGDDRIHGDAGDDILYGGSDADIMFGDDGADILWGEWGDDRLYGGSGNDQLDGGEGRDIVDGGAGRLLGGAGKDRFVWRDLAEGGDTVRDFEQGVDRLVVAGRAVGGLTSVDNSNFSSNANGVAIDANDRFLYAQDSRMLFFDPDGSGAAPATLIAQIQFNVGIQLYASDIVIG
jgi:Ca2+-binding RTX toxin-like protein